MFQKVQKTAEFPHVALIVRILDSALVIQPCPDCFSRPRASRSFSRMRGVSSLFCRFSVLVSLELSGSRGCAAATSAIRGVSRGGCAASPCSGKVPPDSRGQWHQEPRAPSQEPRNFSGIPLSMWYAAGYCRTYLLVGCSGSSVPQQVATETDVAPENSRAWRSSRWGASFLRTSGLARRVPKRT